MHLQDQAKGLLRAALFLKAMHDKQRKNLFGEQISNTICKTQGVKVPMEKLYCSTHLKVSCLCWKSIGML